MDDHSQRLLGTKTFAKYQQNSSIFSQWLTLWSQVGLFVKNVSQPGVSGHALCGPFLHSSLHPNTEVTLSSALLLMVDDVVFSCLDKWIMLLFWGERRNKWPAAMKLRFACRMGAAVNVNSFPLGMLKISITKKGFNIITCKTCK